MNVLASVQAQLARAHVRLLLGLALTLLTLYLALREVSLAEVWVVLLRADPGLVLLSLGAVALNNVAKARRWQVLLGTQRRFVSYGNLLRALLIGQALNVIIPLRVGEVARTYLVGGAGPGRSFTAGTIVLEKVVDMVCYALLFFCSFFNSHCPNGPANPRVLLSP